MTAETTTSPMPIAVPTRAIDGRTMLGHVVVCQGPGDKGGQDIIAVWHVSTEGVNTGAWTVPIKEASTDPAAARVILEQCLRRAVTGWDPSDAAALLSTLERVANVNASDWKARAVTLPDMLREIAETRSVLEKRVAEERHIKKNVIPLEWEIGLPDPIPTGPDELRHTARLAELQPCSAIQEALLLSSLLCWSVNRWQETLTIAQHRDFLNSSLEQLGVLPPRWESRIADAYAQFRSL